MVEHIIKSYCSLFKFVTVECQLSSRRMTKYLNEILTIVR